MEGETPEEGAWNFADFRIRGFPLPAPAPEPRAQRRAGARGRQPPDRVGSEGRAKRIPRQPLKETRASVATKGRLASRQGRVRKSALTGTQPNPVSFRTSNPRSLAVWQEPPELCCGLDPCTLMRGDPRGDLQDIFVVFSMLCKPRLHPSCYFEVFRKRYRRQFPWARSR